jgi:uncharacterized protein (TIGR04222 family)
MESKKVELYQRIQEFSLDEPESQLSFSKRLAKDNGWSLSYTQRAIAEYKKFVFLAVVTGHPVTPSDQIDQVWHLHLSYTRSYWQNFCPNILQMNLHHNPTRGGLAEGLKFEDWYSKTLDSYQQFFGMPPNDIWSAPNDRFSKDLNFVRINTEKNWVIPKFSAKHLRKLHHKHVIICFLLFITSISVASCQGVYSNSNPLNYTGSEFLSFYFQLSILVIFLAYCLRYYLRLPSNTPIQTPRNLDPYEVAYFVDGERRVVDTAIASLFQRNHITIEPKQRRLDWTGPIEDLAHPVEQEVAKAIQLYGFIDSIPKSNYYSSSTIRDRLQNWDLLVKPQQAFIAKLYPTLLIACLLGLGIAKILIGLSRGKPVGFLIVMCVIIAIAGLFFSQKKIHRSRYGDRFLNNLRNHLPSKVFSLNDAQLPFVVALLSVVILPNDAFGELKSLLTPVSSSGGDGSGDGSGGDGGCGGSCGGCGGGD